MDDISLWLALVAGVVSFFSPCIFPLVPAYLAQLTGTNISDGAVNAERRIIMSRSVGFIVGFTTIFLLMGASATLIGEWFQMYSGALEQIGGIIIILFGLQMTGVISLRSLMTEKRFGNKSPKKSTSFLGSVAFGLVFAAGWTPCIGIVLGSILALASTEGSMLAGSGMLFVYSMGLGLPFMAVSLIYARSLNKLSRLNRFLPIVQQSGGVIMIIFGILLFSGYFQVISSYLARISPGWL
ncbi:cytochrome c biogenesis CcdA family protein [Natribacillus halophilus]|uniref:Cytochrome c-type biogenesis protein n=1 Tax=Natribacillus halophilus TaxID=549003 RepID=A0A1G8NXI2_9BACI|nr:cytochrome c biogenesis protein CcdA [Natribacillus halophilus]SDI84728.1 cytochrome c-type biogenesis protein [Natribacillus halophilus]